MLKLPVVAILAIVSLVLVLFAVPATAGRPRVQQPQSQGRPLQDGWPPPGVDRVGQGVTTPRPVQRRGVKYTPEAAALGIEGTVIAVDCFVMRQRNTSKAEADERVRQAGPLFLTMLRRLLITGQ